jgi:tRNA A-37 threonylcarbamoyl transferase component Bud32
VAASDDTGGRRAGSRADSASETVRPRTAPPVIEDDEATHVSNKPQRRIATLPAGTMSPRFMLALGEGSPVGEYEIQSQIGEGAMGTVYSAIHPLIGKTVAIKVLKSELCANQASVDRFVQEAQAVNRIGHPNIVDVFSLGELPDGRAYFVMEWLRGEDLKARLARGPLSLQDACDILDGIARALDAAHTKDIVHRDLKPDNVFLHAVGGGPVTVKLLDFGIAKLLREKLVSERTQTGNMLGTPRYISPEQARGVDVTHRSDIYSLGVMAYEMLAGRAPFAGDTAMDLVVAHMHEAPPPLAQFARVPRALEQCVMRMLAKDPAQRPALADIRRVLVDPTQRVARVDLGVRKRVAIAAVGLALAAGGVGAWQLLDREREPEHVVIPAPLPTPTPTPVTDPVPVPPPAPVDGTIAISVAGTTDARIFVDAIESGRGPTLALKARPGARMVHVLAPGHDVPPPVRVEVTAGQTTNVTIAVTPKQPATAVRRPAVRKPVVSKPAVTTPTEPPPTKKPQLDENTVLRPKGK